MVDKLKILDLITCSLIFIIALYPIGHFSAQSQSQQSLFGRVTDVNSGLPLANANVFIAYSKMGDATDNEGCFTIQDIPAGTFEIVVSMIGYEIQKRTVILPFQSRERIHFKLYPMAIEFPEIVVSAKNLRKRRRNLDIFTERLIGTTWNAHQTKIVNPEVLIFPPTKWYVLKPRVLRAITTEPLIIENRGLGYQITYALEYFEVIDKLTRFAGIPKFDELEPIFEEEPIDWEKNRRIAYEGSLRHFLKSICETYRRTEGKLDNRAYDIDINDIIGDKARVSYNDSWWLEQQGFYVIGIDNPFWEYTPPKRHLVNTNRFLTKADQPNEMYLKFSDYLEITYSKDFEDRIYLRFIEENRSVKKQTSWIKLESDSVLIDIEGRYFETLKLHSYGYWAWERLADMLPYEYKLNDSEEN